MSYDSKTFYSTQVKLTITGSEKLNTYVPKPRLPIWPVHLHSMFRVFQVKESIDHIVLWSFITLAYFAMLCMSQFANSSSGNFSPAEQFTRDHFQFTEYGPSVKMKWSKTEKNMRLAVSFLLRECFGQHYAQSMLTPLWCLLFLLCRVNLPSRIPIKAS